MLCSRGVRWCWDRSESEILLWSGNGGDEARWCGRLGWTSALALAFAFFAPTTIAEGFDTCVDVALVLAVDGSDSIDARE